MKKNLLIFLIISVVIGCVREIDDLSFTTFKPGISFPLGEFSMTADNLTQLGDSINVRTGSGNVIELFYEEEVLNTLMDDRFSIGAQSFNEEIPFSSFLFVAGETNEVKLSAYNSFKIDNADLPETSPELTLVRLKGGNITIEQRKDFSHEVETVISFPTLIKDGVPLMMTMTNSFIDSEDLNGYELDLSGTSGTEANTIDYELSTTVTESGNSAIGTISFSFNMNSMKFSYFEGDFGTYLFDDINADFDLGLPENDIPDNVGFTNPSVKLVVVNSSGIDYGLELRKVGVVEENGDSLTVTGTYDDEIFVLKGAQVEGESVTSEFEIGQNNTDNLAELFSNIPKGAYFTGGVSANPIIEGVARSDNFVGNDSRIVINAEITLPLEGYADNYAINDTINDIDLQFGDDGVVSLDNVNLRFQVENSFPFDVRLQVYFLDSTSQQSVIDSLFTDVLDQTIIPSGNVDASGLVTSSNIKNNDIILDQEKYEAVKLAKAIRVKASIFTPGADQNPRKTVKFTTDNFISIGLGLTGNAIIDPNQIVNN
jgi:hypothetical protein